MGLLGIKNMHRRVLLGESQLKQHCFLAGQSHLDSRNFRESKQKHTEFSILSAFSTKASDAGGS